MLVSLLVVVGIGNPIRIKHSYQPSLVIMLIMIIILLTYKHIYTHSHNHMARMHTMVVSSVAKLLVKMSGCVFGASS